MNRNQYGLPSTLRDALLTKYPGMLADCCAKWESQGMPSIRLSHRLGASLACTSAADMDPDFCAPPWQCFYVHVPTDLILAERGPVTGALFFVDPPGYVTLFATPVGLVSTGASSLAELCRDFELKPPHEDDPGLFGEAGWDGSPAAQSLSPQDHRAAASLRRMMIGIILELSAPQHVERISLGPPTKRPSKRRSDVPLTWDFKLTRDVRLDVRASLIDYCTGAKGKSPTVQILVRGHYKRQAFGPGLTERKWIHIEPYWRGPEDAPIGVRSHVMQDRLLEQPDLDSADFRE